jgi:hypothetical protein
MTEGPDDVDAAILNDLCEIWTITDPPPVDLDLRVLFALDIDNIHVEMAHLHEEALVGAGARATEPTRTITFDSDSLSVMVSITPAGEHLRIDGWLAPPQARRVELRTAAMDADTVDLEAARVPRVAQADEAGRFVFTGVPRGLAQILVSGIDGPTVVTPSIVL